MVLKVYSDKKMEELGSVLADILEEKDVVYLQGELGAGKTTMVRGIARALGYNGRVTSPTFTLMNIYEARIPIYHFDFYRLEKGDIYDLGIDDYIEKDGIVLIEWPEMGYGSLPEEALLLEFKLVNDDYEREREVYITGRGKRYSEKVKELNI